MATSDTKSVTITVKDAQRAPVANPQAVTTDEDTTKPITLTGSDPDNKPITFMIVTLPMHGTLSGTPNQYTSYNGILDFPIEEQLKFYDVYRTGKSSGDYGFHDIRLEAEYGLTPRLTLSAMGVTFR